MRRDIRSAEERVRVETSEESQLLLTEQAVRHKAKVDALVRRLDVHDRVLERASKTSTLAMVTRVQRDERLKRETYAKGLVDNIRAEHAAEMKQLMQLQQEYIVRFKDLQQSNEKMMGRLRKYDELLAHKDNEAKSAQQKSAQVIASLRDSIAAKDQELEELQRKFDFAAAQANAAVAASGAGLAQLGHGVDSGLW